MIALLDSHNACLVRHCWGAANPAAAGGITDPTQIAGCVVWYTADAGTYQDFAGGTPAASDGDPVGAWADRSGNGHHLQQTTTAAKPVLKLAIQNGKPVVRFDGVQTVLPGGAFTLDQPHTRFAVLLGRTTANQAFIDGSTSNGALFYVPASPAWSMYAGSELDSALTPDGAFHIWRGTFNGASSKIAIDDGPVTTGAAGSTSAGGIVLGARGGDFLFPADCDIGEVIEYNSALSDSDVTKVLNYLNSRWGIF
jgi:hypothetical protein